MNILFYTCYEVSNEKGGTERITATIMHELSKNYGTKCYSAFSCKIDSKFHKVMFEKSILLPEKGFVSTLRQFIIDNHIDIIINQGEFHKTLLIHQVIADLNNKYLIFVHHYNPGAEENLYRWERIVYDIKCRKRIAQNIISLLLYPIKKNAFHKKLKLYYSLAYKYSDATILLSDKFKELFKSYAGLNDDKKFKVIHNALSFDSFFDMGNYHVKKKEVLIVSRLAERQKRILLALEIWSEIEKDRLFDDWMLRIVGHGDMDVNKYYAFVQKNHLKRVSFEGMQKPLKYYQQSSIFMLTSAYEGWGLTLTEAQQNACVPIAFNSYASLNDIITHGENGIVIPNSDKHSYVFWLKHLMLHDDERKIMAWKAVETSHRFDKKKIIYQWYETFREIMSRTQ